MEHHHITAEHLSVGRVREILERRLPLALSDDARARIVRCREYLDRKMENLENYIKRLEQLETITGSYPGVDKAYAIQAGREVRVMVRPEQVSEDQMVILARDLAKKIEEEMEYPGQIKVHVLRETKVIEYAK